METKPYGRGRDPKTICPTLRLQGDKNSEIREQISNSKHGITARQYC